ncbi:MAG: c-type cytochrome [Myxococcaceae bacterium]|nr:c-type cytochrome [Myxococcaceae bacterium]
MHRLITSTLAIATLATVGCIRPDGAKKTLPGKELFAACASCHGETGTGQANIAAPNIAGLPAWYVEAQLVKYRSGARGNHPEDLEGLRMRPMSRQMMDEAEVKAVSAYVATLPAVKQAPSVQGGDASAGAAAYATCLACHGDKGQGNQALNAPPLAGQYDWYLVNQLKKFKAGVRGANPADITGGQMRPMSMTLADEQAMKNVVAHISTFSR